MNNINKKDRNKQKLILNQDEETKKLKEQKYINWVSSMEKNVKIILSYIS